MNGSDFDHVDWYNRVAERSGGYRKTWTSTVHGKSGEDAFVETLFSLLEPEMQVLDAGCGSGEFTLEVARRVAEVTGFDFAERMIDAARTDARAVRARNVEFVHASSRDLPFGTNSFDLIYSRRGPTSILLQAQVLRPGGWMVGVHSDRFDAVRARLDESGLTDVQIEEFDALETFPTARDFAAFWSRMPGHPDYSVAENGAALDALLAKYDDGQQLAVPE